MEHKTWLWRKKSSEKTIVVSEKVNISLKGNEDETFLKDKELELETSVKDLNEKLSSALTECNAKDDLVTKHAKVAEEAIAGWEKAEAEAACFKQNLDDALQQRVAAEERTVHLDAALKECMQQLRFVREEQEQRIHDAVMKASKELDKARINFEEKLAEKSKGLAKLSVENGHLSRVLQVKEKLIEDLNKQKSQAEADFNALTTRLDSTEKDNSSLKYEVCMLEKELEIRNKEKDFNRISTDASHKQHLESMKKIAKLETECQRLRLLVRKRLPGPAALAKMKNEVEILGRDETEGRKKKMNPAMGLMVTDYVPENCHETSNKKINFLIERLSTIEDENKILKETLTKRNSELESSRTMCARTTSKLLQAEAQLGELSKGQTSMELARSTPMSYEMTLSSISEDHGNGDVVSCTESWASALISELEHFRNEKPKGTSCKSFGASDLSLMDDFDEMERLAIVSVDNPLGSSHFSSDENNAGLVPLESNSRVNVLESTGKELVPVGDNNSGFSDTNLKKESKYLSVDKFPSWLRDIWRVILEQSRATQRNPDEILDEVRIILKNMNHSAPGEVDVWKGSSDSSTVDPPHISGYISWKPPPTSPVVDSLDGAYDMSMSSKETRSQQFQSNLNKSICKIIDLINGINEPSLRDYSNHQILSENGNHVPYKNSTTLTDYTMRAFQWKSSELSAILQHFVLVCNDLLHGKANLEIFARELTSTLDWILNHCFSLQDVSSMKDTIKKHFDWDESQSESEIEVRMTSPHAESEKVHVPEERKHANEAPSLPLYALLKGQNILSQMEDIDHRLKEENRRLKDDIKNLEIGKKDLEKMLQLATKKNESLMSQLRELEQSITSLHGELATLKESKELIEDQVETQRLLNEDLDTQLSVARVELNEARQKFSSLEVELEDKNNCCQELEATCLELQLQLESAHKEIPKYSMDQEEKQLRTDWEISAASEKLAECQETILNLGKQLKALASPRDAALIDKVIATTPTIPTTKTTHRFSLLDQMLAEDDVKTDMLKSPKTKEIICTTDPRGAITTNNSILTNYQASPVKPPGSFYGLNETRHGVDNAVGALAIVPKRQGGGSGLLRKLLLRKKREKSKKPMVPIVAAQRSDY